MIKVHQKHDLDLYFAKLFKLAIMIYLVCHYILNILAAIYLPSKCQTFHYRCQMYISTEFYLLSMILS